MIDVATQRACLSVHISRCGDVRRVVAELAARFPYTAEQNPDRRTPTVPLAEHFLMTPLWISFASLIVALIALDLGVLRRIPRRVGRGAALGWTVFWFGIALAFNGGIHWAYNAHWQGLGLAVNGASAPVSGEEASLQFLAAFLIETCLSLDNVFVMGAIFTHFKVPERLRQRVLTTGLLVALVGRGAIASLLVVFTSSFSWSIYVLGVLLLLAALRMVVIRQQGLDPQKNLIARITRFFFPMTESLDGANLVTRVNGRLALTSLMTALVFIETADMFFAAETIPAALAVSKDPFLIVTSNVFAVFVTRSMYFAIADLTSWIRYVKIGLALVLAYVAVLMINVHRFTVPTEVSLVVLFALVGAGVVAALLFAKPGPAPTVSPLGEDADRVAKIALKQAAKVISLVVGSTVTIIGILMLPGPGPGLVVIPIGLAILAAEFVWARRLLQKYTETAQKLGEKAGSTLIKQPRPWLIPLVVGATVSAVVAVVLFTSIKHSLVASFGGGALIGQSIWGYMQMSRYRQTQARMVDDVRSNRRTAAPLRVWPVVLLIVATLGVIAGLAIQGRFEVWRLALSSVGVLLGEFGAIVVIRAQARGVARLIAAAKSGAANGAVRPASGALGDTAA